MIYDLNIAWTPSTPADALDCTLRQAAVLGYDVVALNHTISRLPIPSPITNPIPLLSSSSSSTDNRRRLPSTILRRATVHMADPRDNHRLDAVAAAYDVLAVRPTTEAAFSHACVALAEPSVISLDLASNLGYHFRPKPVMAAVRRGVRFEVCYSQAIVPSSSSSSSSSSGDGADNNSNNRARALFVANLVGLVRASKGRGLVVSSGCPASRPALLRAPADVVNLLAVWGLAPDKGLEALSAAPRGVVVNEGIKRSSFRGVVDIVQAAGGGAAAAAAAGAVGETTVVTGRKKQKQQQQQQKVTSGGSADGGKRRKGQDDAMAVDDDPSPETAGASAAGDGGAPSGKAHNGDQQQQQGGVKRKNGEQAGAGDVADEAGQKLSKRQAKKQRRLAAQQAQTADAGP
ncbi:hypothetical protein GGTG_07757 [Gaeumannomyces tritici R3-111a-1]|uniref:Uncharacterized protein n=1 Tax=Gaeumannomyces tritici (strain R3-111a-1) TaxID=644352 RepID=J3P2L1_GAET3|nr:hypothetical protein GGTG_07757 [Gaeumannomyces tritici R3-111a-1]EJT73903.1 hypothetical protein GGTG_07757 [Gaeumannomyces tritici R3-111a-1]